jgi:hypothetical protein
VEQQAAEHAHALAAARALHAEELAAAAAKAALASATKVSVLLFTVTFYANLAHSLTRSP